MCALMHVQRYSPSMFAALFPEHAGQAQRDRDGQGPFAADQIRHRGHENQ